MSIHSRRAAGEVLNFLEKYRTAGTPVLHWFSGSLGDLNHAISLDCWFSVGPSMLLSKNGRTIASRLPKDRVLRESDGPFAQLDGKTVKPWHVERAIQVLGETWSIQPQKVEQTLRQNLKSLIQTNKELAV